MSNNPGKKPTRARNHGDRNGLKITGFIWTILPGILLASLFFSNQHLPLPNINDEEWWGTQPIEIKSDDAIRPYKVEFPVEIIHDLKERLLHRRPFIPPLENLGFTYGFNSEFLTRILDFWQNSYNFKERENFLNKYKHYITNIQGLDIHYIHVQPDAPPDVVKIPILLIHGWPSSIREFYDIIPLLTSSRNNPNFVFEVIAPSLPGFGFSQAPTRQGMGPIQIAVILNSLMKRVGHTNYYIHGSNFGYAIGSVMATVFPNNVQGIHFTGPLTVSHTYGTVYKILDTIWPSWLEKPIFLENQAIWIQQRHLLETSGYYDYYMQPNKPDTIGIALSESPAGLAAYILEKFSNSPENRQASDGGILNKFSPSHLLDNVMIYWVTNCMTTTMRNFIKYYSDMAVIDQNPTDVPAWSIKFKSEFLTSDESLKNKYHNLLGMTVVDSGEARFPAMEHPQILVADISKSVTTFRSFHSEMQKSQPVAKNPETEPKNFDATENDIPKSKPKTVYDFTVKDILGQEVSLEKYRGKVLIIVNVASHCGYTDTHYTQLNELYEKYANRGLRILAFPCNQFGGQEPGSLHEILQFTKKRNVKFDIFEKIEVNGDNTHPLWNFLKNTQKGTMGDFIKWNFSKFIIDRNGFPVGRFGPNVDPVDLEPYLAEYW